MAISFIVKSSYVNQPYCNLTTLELHVSREQIGVAMLTLPCHGDDAQELSLLCGERATYPCWKFRLSPEKPPPHMTFFEYPTHEPTS